MATLHITVHGADRAAMADIVRVHGVRVYGQTLKEVGDGLQVDGVGDDAAIDRLTAAGYRVDRHEDIDEAARESLQDVGTGNRFEAEAAAAPLSYLNVDEVDTAMQVAARAPNAGFTELITLPHTTWDHRTCHAIRVHHGSAAAVGVYFLGGVHAREWGSPDILVNFVKLLTDAYRTSAGISQGGMNLDAGKVAEIVENLDVVVFPQANPDGRHHSMTVDPMWRKNRRPAGHGDPHCAVGGGNGPGVDINRNYDFLWDFPTAFSPQAPVQTSTNPCKEVYRGPSAASEPETANVTWLLDRVPSIGYFIDVHSFGEDILYNWGDDDDQTGDPNMNFRNPAFDGKRGITDSTPGGDPGKYSEYLPSADLNDAVHLGTVMSDAITAAHGRQYSVKGAVGLYPTSGTSDDYAYSRSFVDTHKSKVLGYTIEWGPQRSSIPKSFHPDYPDMVPIIEEITAALLAFCSELAGRLATPVQDLAEVKGTS
jgi:carboxypeptidase T